MSTNCCCASPRASQTKPSFSGSNFTSLALTTPRNSGSSDLGCHRTRTDIHEPEAEAVIRIIRITEPTEAHGRHTNAASLKLSLHLLHQNTVMCRDCSVFITFLGIGAVVGGNTWNVASLQNTPICPNGCIFRLRHCYPRNTAICADGCIYLCSWQR